jgi:hypothetical protein
LQDIPTNIQCIRQADRSRLWSRLKSVNGLVILGGPYKPVVAENEETITQVKQIIHQEYRQMTVLNPSNVQFNVIVQAVNFNTFIPV